MLGFIRLTSSRVFGFRATRVDGRAATWEWIKLYGMIGGILETYGTWTRRVMQLSI